MRPIDAEELLTAFPPGEMVRTECVRATIKQMPDLQPNLQPTCNWIPVTEKLPIVENYIGKRVLVTTTWGLTAEAMYCKDHWEIHDIPYKLTSVTAWMPLPKPYEGSEQDE